ncbi:MAG TPA: M23 family metallopeptidase [Deltaproteobacteria bacterium]|nr:M23 family metallopeptidase [Deltaproteobacteria bacterium]HOI06228.1 M23 family metallopeptidase [Deltaproteobacteria bacterium]
MRKAGMIVSFLVVIFVVVAASALVYHYLEWEKPQVRIQEAFDMVGNKRNVNIDISDLRSGIRSVTVSLVQKDHPFEIAREEIPEAGTTRKTMTVEVSPRKLRMKDGPAVFQIQVVDYSPLRNTTIVQRNVTVDMKPLHVSLLTMAHNVNPGGTCMAAYTLSKPVLKSGVQCGDVFSPGYPQKTANGKTYYVCYFPVPIDVSKATVMNVVANDRAGNQAVVSIPFYIRSQWRFYADKLGIGQDFITRKANEFLQEYPDLEGKTVEEAFTYINVDIRKGNENTIREVSRRTGPEQLWDGSAFLMMKNGATRARFADKRTYLLDGKPIGESVHLGIDVASTERAPIEAFNSGTVVFASSLGIYGNAIIIDHGQGIASLYGHLSSIQVSEGQQVQKGQVIAASGATGWAGGDHLHFSMMVNGIFVNPIEWWDSHWIQDNVTRKLQGVQDSL